MTGAGGNGQAGASAAGDGRPPRYRIVTVPGDGIGPEIIVAGRKALEATGRAFGFELEWTEIQAGGAGIDAYGIGIRPEDVELAAASDAVYLGAVGGPKWDNPNGTIRPEQALFALRGGLDLFANLRPVKVHPVLRPSSPVRPELLEGVDLLIVRELTSGLYFGKPSEERKLDDGRAAIDTLWYTEAQIRRVVRLAFELARGRRRNLTSVDKANVLASSRLWRKIVDELRPEFPDVEASHQLVDSMAMFLVRRPASFDVVVTENMFGDILSDEASVLAGSLGMLPSASVGSHRTAHGLLGLYEPIHGSAPAMAGQDRANPIGTIMSGAMLLRWSLGQAAAADALEAAVSRALDDGFRTPDLMRDDPNAAEMTAVGTQGMVDAIVDRIAIPRAAPATAAAQDR